MKENWTDFEKYVFNKLERIDSRIGRVEVRAAALASLLATLIHFVFKH